MKKVNFILILTLLGSLLAGCASKPAAGDQSPAGSARIELTDGLNRTLTLDEPPQTIVSMAASVTEILYAVGAGSQVIGRDSFSDYPEEALSVQDIGGSMGDFSLETIASLNPDLVLATETITAEQVKSLEDLGLTVYYIANPDDLNGLFPIIQDVGRITGHTDEAKSLVDSLQARVEAVTAVIAKADSQPSVFYELDGTDPAKPWTPGPGTFVEQMIQMAGGKNVGSVLTGEWAQISLEEILVQDPDVIILGDSIYGMTPEAVAARSGWGDLTAVKEDKLFEFDDDLVSRPGPRMVDGLEALAKIIHPELFK